MLSAIGGLAGVACNAMAVGRPGRRAVRSGWPAVGIGQLLAVLVRLPSRLSDPAGAWPVVVRRELPGAGGFYAALAILAGAGGRARV